MYQYIGPPEIRKQVKAEKAGKLITLVEDIQLWIETQKLKPDINDEIIVTFIINLDNQLRINPRESEHVVCANGEPVLSAGEMAFEMRKSKVIAISQITNQSTGYCPSTNSWQYVVKALSLLKVPFPDYFTTEYVFRICKACKCINIVKDNYYFCSVCDQPLSLNEYER